MRRLLGRVPDATGPLGVGRSSLRERRGTSTIGPHDDWTTVRWTGATATTRGRHHEATGQPNEDHCEVVLDGPVLATVADGHGAATYTRAARGSELATAVARDLLGADPPSDVAGELVGRWRDRVAEDLEDDPPPREETRGQPPYVLYGTTVLAARVEGDHLRVVQLGDGDLLLWSHDGGTTRPLPTVEAPFPNATDSLVQADAIDNVRTGMVDLPDLVLLATDGLEAARGGPGWEQAVIQQLRDDLVTAGPDGLGEVLQRWTDEGAETGGDDTTLAVLVRRELLDGS